jgi:predicted AAA+ superfamily ATPase
MDKSVIRTVIADNRVEVPKYKVISRDFTFEEFANYVFVGIRRAGKSYMLYQRMQQLLTNGIDSNQMLYINFEDERLTGMTAADLNILMEVHLEVYGKKPILFLMKYRIYVGWEKFARRRPTPGTGLYYRKQCKNA